MNLAQLTAEMRAMGIKSLAIELESQTDPTYTLPPESAPTDAPPPSPEPELNPNQCAFPGCGEDPGGVLGGKLRQYCRKHAFAQLGIR